MAIAIAYRAIQNGFDAFFTTAATLVDDLEQMLNDYEDAGGKALQDLPDKMSRASQAIRNHIKEIVQRWGGQ